MAELVDARVLGTRIFGCGSSSLPDRIKIFDKIQIKIFFKNFIKIVKVKKNSLVLLLSYIYFVLGIAFLFVPSIAIELGRPKDLLRGGLFFLLAIFLLIKKNTFTNSDLIIILLNNLICFILIAEINIGRWNNLSETEKKSLRNLSVIKNKLLLFLDALKLGNKNLLSKSVKASSLDKNADKRLWVRSEKENLEESNSQLPSSITKNTEVTNLTKKDIIVKDNN